MFAYTHLAHEERYPIYVLKKADIQQSEIAARLACTLLRFPPLRRAHRQGRLGSESARLVTQVAAFDMGVIPCDISPYGASLRPSPGDWRLPTDEEWQVSVDQATDNLCSAPYFPDSSARGVAGWSPARSAGWRRGVTGRLR